MGQGYSMLGFVVIVILYAVIGLMAAAGAIFVARKILAPKAEQIFFAMFLRSRPAIRIRQSKSFAAAPVCLSSCNGPFGIVDVERPCPSTTYFEEIALTRRCSEPLPAWPFLAKVSTPGWRPV
jgi:hypothetical protein